MAKKLIEVYERNTSSDEAKPEGKQTFVSGHWRTYGGEKKVKPEKNVEQKKIKEAKKSSASKGLGDQKAPLRSMSILNAKIAKNTAVLPSMAKDINTMRTNLDKFLGSVGSDGGGFGSPNLFGKGKRNRRVGKQNPRMGKKGILLGALGIGAVGAAGYVAAEAYGEKTAESPERKKEREDKEAKKIDAGEIPAPQTPIETPAPSVEATPTPAPAPAPTPLSPMLQNMMPGATLRQQAGLPAMIPTTPSAAPVAPPLRPGEVSGKIRRADSSAGGGRGNVNPELVRGTDIEVPSNVIRDAQGNPVRTQDGGFVISGQPDVSIPNPPAPVPVRPAPTPAPSRPTPAPSRPTPAPVTPSTGRNYLKEAVNNKEFMAGVDALAKKYNTTREDLLSFMMNESGLNPAAKNITSPTEASGLIQITNRTFADMKNRSKVPSLQNVSTLEDLRKLTIVEQLPIIDDYLKIWKTGQNGKANLATL